MSNPTIPPPYKTANSHSFSGLKINKKNTYIIYIYYISIYYYGVTRLKERENIKRDDGIKLKEEGKDKLQRIANEIEKDKENKIAKVI